MGNLLAPKDFGLQGLSGHYYNQAYNNLQPSALKSLYGGYTDVGQRAVMDALNDGTTPDQIAQIGKDLTSAGVFDGGLLDNSPGYYNLDSGQQLIMDQVNAGVDPEIVAKMGASMTQADIWGSSDDAGKWFSDNALGLAKIGVAGFGLINDRQQLGLAKRALQDQLENSKMQREMTADQLRIQAGVRSSLARAFGGSTKPYEKSLGLAEKYANKDT
jgi:hypothetical protein